jgi:nucleoside-diphosphate-sugar epimerase
MTRVLVTGIDGFTGRYLTPRLVEAGYEVHGLVHIIPHEAVPGSPELHRCDITNLRSVVEVVRAVRPERVVHLAGISFVADSPEKMYEVNLLGSRHLLEALAGLPDAPSAILLASSANVYGNSAEGVLHEETPTVPANDYAVSKLAMEHVAGLFATRLPLTICRPFNYTGVGQSESFLLPKIVAHVRQARPVIELGNLDVARDFSDVRVVADIYARLIECAGAVGRTINVCSGKAYTLREVVAMASEISGHALEVRVNPAFVRANEVKRLLGSRARLEALLGSIPAVPLMETIRWMISA